MALLLKGLYVGTRNETINVPLDQRNRFSLVICVDGALARTYVRVVRLCRWAAMASELRAQHVAP